jgi:hypothetical protein
LTVAGLVLAALIAHAAPTKDAKDLAGTWTLEEGSSDDPVRLLRGERGRGGGRIAGNASIFGIPVGGPGGLGGSRSEDSRDKPKPEDLGGVEHVFEATYRLNIKREGNVTEIRYGAEPTIKYYDGTKLEHGGAVARPEWQGGVFTVKHELADGSLAEERYWVDARSGELHWTAELTSRKSSVDVERVFYRSPASEQ